MKFFMAGLDTETNTFSPIPTGMKSFEESLLAYGDATSRPLNYCSAQLAVWRQMGVASGCTVVEGLCAVAEPAGKTGRHVYEGFRASILDELRNALPVDFVILALHGAMVADGYDDVEGDLLAHVRAIVGPLVPIGAELDLHAHLSEKMLESATVILSYKEYPHTDIEICANQLFDIVLKTAKRLYDPQMASYDCRMVGTFPTQKAPLRDFVDRMRGFEGKDGILSVSFIHGFRWGNVPDVGARILVISDGNSAQAAQLAERLGKEIWGLRNSLLSRSLSIDEALDEALCSPTSPVVLADASDNSGGGAPSDSTFLLRRIIERRILNVVSAMYWDPIAVRFCKEAGEGASFDLRLGGKSGPSSGAPLDLHVTVRKISSGLTQRFGNVPLPVGDASWVTANGVDIIINTQRVQVFHPEIMSKLGLDPTTRHIIVVKSSNHFYAAFSQISERIIWVNAPGALESTFVSNPLTRCERKLWPYVEDPFL